MEDVLREQFQPGQLVGGEVDFAAERGAGIPARGQTRVDAAVAVERAGERGLDALRVEVGGEAEVGIADHVAARVRTQRSEEHTSELQSLMRISYAGFCLKKKNKKHNQHH